MSIGCRIGRVTIKAINNVQALGGSHRSMDTPVQWPLIQSLERPYKNVLVIGEYENGSLDYLSNFCSGEKKVMMMKRVERGITG